MQNSVAQNPSSQSAPATLHNTTRAVVLDVIVTDKAGKPVSDLSWKDFTVLQDNVPQLIALFERPDQHRFSIPTTGNKTNDQSRPPAMDILVIDESNPSLLDPARTREVVTKFLRNYGPRLPQPMALVTVNAVQSAVQSDAQLELLHDYTEDANALQQTLDRHAADFPSHGATNSSPSSEPGHLVNALHSLEKIAAANMNFAGRKNVIWVGPAFPAFDLSRDEAKTDEVKIDKMTIDRMKIANEIWDARLAIYSVDPRGLQGTAPTANDASGGTRFAESIAAQTGGKVFFNRNDADVAIANSITDSSDYYTLSYYPQNDWDGKFRNLHVTVGRPGLTTRTRPGYYATPDTTHDEATIFSELTAALSNPLPYRGLGVSVAYKLQSGTPRMARYTIAADRHDLSWQSTPDGNRRCEITALVASASGKDPLVKENVKNEIKGLEGTVKSDRFEKQMDEPMLFTFTAEFPSDEGPMRVVVRDNKTGRIGTADLDMNDSAKKRR